MFLIGGIPGATLGQHVQERPDRPNILFIICDQFRYDCQGITNPVVKTPNLNRLTSQGMRFSNAFSPIPTCCPARQSLFSGKWPAQHKGLWNYDITLPVSLFNEHTWSEDLKGSGYSMGYVGKWHVSPEKTPLDFGYEDYVSDAQYQQWRKQQGISPAVPALNGNRWMGGRDPAALEQTHTHWLAENAIGLIKKYAGMGKPWHVVLSLSEPHLPCNPVQAFLNLYDAAKIKPWGNFPDSFVHKPYIQKQQLYNWGIENYTWKQWAVYVQHYYAMISQADSAIGMVLNTVHKMGLDENTVVIFTADHGDAGGSHGMIDKHYVMYEEEVHVPLIIKWKGVTEPGSHCDNFILNGLDLSATIPDLAGFQFTQSRGGSLVPLMSGKHPSGWRKFAFSNYNGQQFGLYVERMIRSSNLKYIWNLTDVDELYDLKRDPWEMNNLISTSQYQDSLKYLRAALYTHLKREGDPIINWVGEKQLLDGKKQE
ncbi:sulfatase-like hydrolase/transferase [Compostibacter hankyongensis]|uniref:Sulfatase-like hydrolase/transferase n=1 Tax=Compostibacter hankyongensis TaxID=1007089 RepID=A0ABP8FBB9_9BACT